MVALVALLGGCSPYVLRGKVVGGGRSTVTVVEAGGPELAGRGIEQAAVQLMLDPRSGGRQMLGTVFTDEAGRFEMPVEALGAGTLEYELLVIARHPGRAPAEAVIDLPGRGKRVLARLAEGRDRPVDAGGWNSAVRELGGFDEGAWEDARRADPDGP